MHLQDDWAFASHRLQSTNVACSRHATSRMIFRVCKSNECSSILEHEIGPPSQYMVIPNFCYSKLVCCVYTRPIAWSLMIDIICVCSFSSFYSAWLCWLSSVRPFFCDYSIIASALKPFLAFIFVHSQDQNCGLPAYHLKLNLPIKIRVCTTVVYPYIPAKIRRQLKVLQSDCSPIVNCLSGLNWLRIDVNLDWKHASCLLKIASRLVSNASSLSCNILSTDTCTFWEMQAVNSFWLTCWLKDSPPASSLQDRSAGFSVLCISPSFFVAAFVCSSDPLVTEGPPASKVRPGCEEADWVARKCLELMSWRQTISSECISQWGHHHSQALWGCKTYTGDYHFAM